MQIDLIAEYEASYRPAGEPALVLFHIVRGHEAARLGAAEVAELRELLAVSQKRIRSLGPYQLILGAGGDMALHGPDGRRACYLNPDQAQRLARLIGAGT